MAMIQVQHLTFAYEGNYDNIFEDVSFQLDTSWRLGFIGRNGRGKTTFLRLLQGTLPYAGTISTNVTFDYFPFAVKNKDWLTVDIAEEICPNFAHWALVKELNLLEVDEEVLYRPFSTLSNGERTKVLLCILFLKENNFLLIDEPTNHLDQHGRAVMSRYLQKKSGFIVVSHDRAFLDGCIDHVLCINRADITVQQGNFTTWQENKARQDQYELAKNVKLKKEIAHLKTAARQTAAWSDNVEASKTGTHVFDRGHVGHMAAKMMKRSKATEARQLRAAQEKETLLKNLEKADALKIRQRTHPKAQLLMLQDLQPFFDDTPVCEPVSFTLSQGDRVAVTGKNGCGKSTILKTILGEHMRFSGKLQCASGLVCSYVQQDTAGLVGTLSAYALQYGIDLSLFQAILRKLDFQRIQFEKPMESFSEGQKKKVLLARSLCEEAHLLVWDEPLNFIDVLSRMQIEQLLCDFQPTMLFVEHDKAFVDKIQTKQLQLTAVHEK